ncbi:restriction endonuclease subunit S [Coraliomargarita sinensis]|uniref:restriction endonuclease subunit S n=1 Tax=Coraliomargarita sinensis TaxID=2174842 RepID=UPI0011B5906D|nr:restriction endonuclease subunit S [Coraliomargarita sinensis]
MSTAEQAKEGFYLSEDGEFVPNGWVNSQLNQVISDFIDYRGKTPKKTNYGIPLITAKVVKDGRVFQTEEYIAESEYDSWMRRGIPKAGDVILTTEAPLGEVAFIPKGKIALAQRIITLRGKTEELDNGFLKYSLQSPLMQYRLTARESGSTVSGIKSSELKVTELLHPEDLNEQVAIAAVLNSLDDKIELLREQNETLEALAQTLFKRWFIDFNFPDENGNPYKDSGGNVDELEETSLDSFVDLNPIEKIDRQREYLFFDMKCLPLHELNLQAGVFKKSLSATSFREGDTLLAKITPCLENGKTGLVQDLKGEDLARGSTEFIVMRAKSNGSKCFNYCLARSSKFRNYAIRSMSGSSGRQRVPVDRVKSYSVINKSELIRYFEALVAPNFEKIKANAQQIETLIQLRDTLLPKLMKGEIRVSIE